MAEGTRGIAREVILRAVFGPRPPFDAEAAVMRLLDASEEIVVAPGEVLGRADEPSEHVFVMAEGRVRLVRPGLADWVYRGRWSIGTIDAVLRRPRRRTIVAETGGRMLRAPARAYLDLLEADVDLASITLLALARGVDQAIERLGIETAEGAGAEAAAARGPALDPRSTVGRLALLERVPVLAGATLQAVADIAATCEVVELDAGEVLVDPARPDPRVLVVARGLVELAKGSAPRGRFGAGDAVGGVLWHVAGEGGFRAVTAAPTVVLAFAVDDWLDRLEEHPALASAGVAALTAARERLHDRLAERLGELVLD